MLNFNLLRHFLIVASFFICLITTPIYSRGEHEDHDHFQDEDTHYDLYDRTVDNADFNPYDYPPKPKKHYNTHHLPHYYEDPDFEGQNANNQPQPQSLNQNRNQNQNQGGQFQR